MLILGKRYLVFIFLGLFFVLWATPFFSWSRLFFLLISAWKEDLHQRKLFTCQRIALYNPYILKMWCWLIQTRLFLLLFVDSSSWTSQGRIFVPYFLDSRKMLFMDLLLFHVRHDRNPVNGHPWRQYLHDLRPLASDRCFPRVIVRRYLSNADLLCLAAAAAAAGPAQEMLSPLHCTCAVLILAPHPVYGNHSLSLHQMLDQCSVYLNQFSDSVILILNILYASRQWKNKATGKEIIFKNQTREITRVAI